MRAGTIRRRGARTALALLGGLLVGGWVGGGLVWVLHRSKYRDPDKVADVALKSADELEMVPADAIGFAHARLADLWKTEAMAEFRKVVEKAGPDAVKALDEGFVPAPSSVDRATVVVIRGEPPPRPPEPAKPPARKGAQTPKGGVPPVPVPLASPEVFAILAFSAPYDAAKVREANMPAAIAETSGGKEYWVDHRTGVAVYFRSDRLMVLGTRAAVKVYLSREPNKTGPLAPAIKLAASGQRHLVAAVNKSEIPLPVTLPAELVPELGPVLRADAFTLGLVVGNGAKVDIRANYKTEEDARKAEEAARTGAEAGRKKLAEFKPKMEEVLRGKPGDKKPRDLAKLPEAIGSLFALGAINMLDDWLKDPPLKRDGTELAVTIDMPSLGASYATMSAASIGMLLPAVQKVREAASRVSDSNNLKQLALGMHNYHDTMGRLPPPAGGWPQLGNGKTTGDLSWRVALLPYLDQVPLYNEFHQDEPWDSPHNKALIPKMPKIYMSPRAPAEPGKTYYKVFVGGGAIFDRDPQKRAMIATIADGTSNTIMIAEGGDPVVWTKPDDFEFDPNKPLPKLALPGTPGINVAMADGSVRYIDVGRVPEQTLKAAITANGGEIVDLDGGGGVPGGVLNPFPNAPVPKNVPKAKGVPPQPKTAPNRKK